MNTLLPILPIALPLLGAVIGLLARHGTSLQATVGIATSVVTLIASVFLLTAVHAADFVVLYLGDWQAPFGISLVADRFAAIMTVVSSLVGLATSIYAVGDVKSKDLQKWFFPLVQFLIMGVNGAFLTGDLFNLYVWFEVMLISSFALMTIGGSKPQFEGGFKYVAINLVSSAFFLAGLGLLYGKLGTLNMADVALKLSTDESGALANSSAILFFIAFSIKAGLFPFFFWLPASYHTPPMAVTALFAGLLTKVGVYAFYRCFTLVFTQDPEFMRGTLLALTLATMLVGVLGAASRYQMSRILSFHIISQIGYIMLGLALFTELAIAACIFYTIHHIVVKSNLFFIAGIASKKLGSDDVLKIGGLYKSAPWLALLFFVPAFSLGGIPPLSGFWAKFALIKASLDVEGYWVATIALAVGVMTLYSMTKIWGEAFWKAKPAQCAETEGKAGVWHYLPVVGFAAITLYIGLMAQPLFSFSEEAARQLLDPSLYMEAVLPAEYLEEFSSTANEHE